MLGYRLLIALICLVFSLLSPQVSAQDAAQQQNQIKLAYLFHFLQLVKWPNEETLSADHPVVLCTVGRDPFGEHLEALGRKKVRGRSVVVRRLTDATHMEACHLLFLSAGTGIGLSELLRRAEGGNALTVSDLRDFTLQGGMIGFVLAAAEQEGGVKVRFEINLEVARRKGLQVSSKLLELATMIRQ